MNNALMTVPATVQHDQHHPLQHTKSVIVHLYMSAQISTTLKPQAPLLVKFTGTYSAPCSIASSL